MRTTVTIDDSLIAQAQELTGISNQSALIRASIESLIALESSRRLAAFSGTMPDIADVPRRRSEQ